MFTVMFNVSFMDRVRWQFPEKDLRDQRGSDAVLILSEPRSRTRHSRQFQDPSDIISVLRVKEMSISKKRSCAIGPIPFIMERDLGHELSGASETEDLDGRPS